jgi:hypothetical protein
MPSGFSTYLGGSQDDYGNSVTVDAVGDTIITTATDSPDFPVTVGSYHGGFDIAVTKLAPDGSLVWSGLYGGSRDDYAGVALDGAGNVYLTGSTDSPDFPTTPGAYDSTFTSILDNAYVMMLDGATGAVIYSTLLSGTMSTWLPGYTADSANGIAVDAAGDAYVVGETIDSDFPTTAGAYQPAYGGGGWDAFLTELNPDGSGLIYSTYLGGGDNDEGNGIAVDATGDVYVEGLTYSTDFPTTAGAFQPTLQGSQAVFVTKLAPGGTALDFSTYIGGSSGSVDPAGLAVDASGAAYVTGFTATTDFPTTAGAFQTTDFGSDEAFVTKLDPTGGSLAYSTYLGGTGDDDASGLAVDGSGHVFVSGSTDSADFPTTAGAPATTLDGPWDAFVTELNPAGSGLNYSTFLGGGDSDYGSGIGLDAAGNAHVTGNTLSTDFATSASAFQAALGGGNDAFVTVLPTGENTTVTINQAAGQSDPTNSAPITFDVTFSNPVTGFDASGIDLSASTAAGSLKASVAGSGSQYSVTVTGMTGPGTVVAKVRAGAAHDPFGGSTPASTSTDNTVTFDNVPPTVTVGRDPAQADPTNASPIAFDIQFDEPVTAVDQTMLTLGGTLAADASIDNFFPGAAANSWVVLVGVTGVDLTGTVTVSVPAGETTDPAGNSNTASGGDNSVMFDNVPPTVTVAPDASQADPAGGSSVLFDVTFSEPVVGFDAGAVDLTGTTAPGAAASVTDNGDHTHFTVTVSGMTQGGTVQVAVDGGVVTDLIGNPNDPSNSSSVTYVHSGTLQFSAPNYTVNLQGTPTLQVVVTRTGGDEGPLMVDYAAADGTAHLGIDYGTPSGNGTLSWADGDTADRTFSIPILDDGAPEDGSDFTLALSNVSLQGALGSPKTSTVTIYEAVLALAAPAFGPFAQAGGTGTADIVVQRLLGTHGTVTVHYLTADGTDLNTAAAGRDYTATSGTLTWGDGDTDPQTIHIPLLDDGKSHGVEDFTVTLDAAGGNGVLGDITTATVRIDKNHGATIPGLLPKGQKLPAPFADADGDAVTVRLGGKAPGSGLTYYLTDGVGPISEIDLDHTDSAKSTVSITVKKLRGADATHGRVGIGEVDGTGLKSFTAKAGDLTGAGFNLTGFAGLIAVGDVTNGADVELLGPAPSAKSATQISAGAIGDGTDIHLAAPLGSLTAVAVGKGTIEAPSVGSIIVKGQRASKTKPFVTGNFESNLTVAGAGQASAKVPALKSLRVAGNVTGAIIEVGGGSGTFGDVGSVSVGSFVNSDLFAGYSGLADGSGTFNLPSTVRSFAVTGTTNAFASSYVIASNIKSVSLASAQTENGGTADGFVFHISFGPLKVKSLALTYTGAGATQTLQGDLEVKRA